MDEILKKAAYSFLLLVTGIFLLFTVLYLYTGNNVIAILTFFGGIIHFLFFFIPYKLHFRQFQPLIAIYLAFIIIFLYPLVLVCWKIGQPLAFVWYSLVPVGVALFYLNVRKIVVGWCIFIIILCVSILISVHFIPEEFVITFSNYEFNISNSITVLASLSILLLFLFNILKINDFKNNALLSAANGEGQNKQTQEVLSEEKCNELYSRILNYFEKKKPYLDVDFSESQLATDLNTNITYISACIRIKENLTFTIFLNKYRINRIKLALKDNDLDKFTLQHIYSLSGYRHQSTFNRMFKTIEGITPSEYIQKIKATKASPVSTPSK
ncbi:MAG: AraC family transcriptional regulator [Bacteroidales bacterium]|jgi:AraC-like DNA-binding protein|nr:AraC family transcriptional regulator [Bacteroidales bacterium]